MSLFLLPLRVQCHCSAGFGSKVLDFCLVLIVLPGTVLLCVPSGKRVTFPFEAVLLKCVRFVILTVLNSFHAAGCGAVSVKLDGILIGCPLCIKCHISGTALLYLSYLVFILFVTVPALEGITFPGGVLQLDGRCLLRVGRRIALIILALIQLVGDGILFLCLTSFLPLRVQGYLPAGFG